MLIFYSEISRSIPWTKEWKKRCDVYSYFIWMRKIMLYHCVWLTVCSSLSPIWMTFLHECNFLLRPVFSVYEMRVHIWEWLGDSVRLRTNTNRTRIVPHWSGSVSQNILWRWLLYKYLFHSMTESFVWRYSQYATYTQTHKAGGSAK